MTDAGERYFCSQASRANGETLYGTVARIRSWLLIEYPSVWRRDAVGDSRLFSPAVKAHLRRLGFDRTLLVRQTHTATWPARVLFVDSCGERPNVLMHEIEDYEQLLRLDRSATGQRVSGPILAVCTHARHDKCCAKFGMPLWCALRDHMPERAWQCSHVGGDRFAGNVVVFPHGLYYGRVTPEDVAELVRRSEAGEVWLPRYRGRSCWARPVQVAEYFLRRETGELRIDAFRPVSIEGPTVEFEARYDSGSRHRVEVTVRPDVFRQRLTCEADEESPVSQYELAAHVRVPG